jgi:hypothetical protein
MCRFEADDPDEFYDNTTYRITHARHEAAHLLLAYYFGFEIGEFHFSFKNGWLTGSVKNVPSVAVRALAVAIASSFEAQKILAGEIAGRISCNIRTDRITVPVETPPAHTINGHTVLNTLVPRAGFGTATAF